MYDPEKSRSPSNGGAIQLMHHIEFIFETGDYFEHPSMLPSTHEFYNIVLPFKTKDFQLSKRGLYTVLASTNQQLPDFGWKIHISATPDHARFILRCIAPIVIDSGCSFKYVSDEKKLKVINGKSWPRATSGKFVTIYPTEENQFRELCESLTRATAGLKGPRILSDRSVANGGIVYYRFGSFKSQKEHFKTREGLVYKDVRKGNYSQPPWLKDPLGSPAPRPKKSRIILNGNYLIHSALQIGNSGGIYKATDIKSNRKVVIKEARPLTHIVDDSGRDAVYWLHHTHRILHKLNRFNIGPKALHTFQQGGHHFAVYEYFAGDPLMAYCQNFEPTKEGKTKRKFVISALSDILKQLIGIHNEGIFHNDLTAANVLVGTNGEIKILDFELATNNPKEKPRGFTPGYNCPPSISHYPIYRDLFALGITTVDLFWNVSPWFALNPKGLEQALVHLKHAKIIDEKLDQFIRRLTHLNQDPFCDAADAMDFLTTNIDPPPRYTPSHCQISSDRTVIEGLVTATINQADIYREDRLWKSHPEVFSNNQSLLHGAIGTIHFLEQAGQDTNQYMHWLDAYSNADKSQGLNSGKAGLVRLLLTRSEVVAATNLFNDLMEITPCEQLGYLDGCAGIGSLALEIYRVSAQDKYLEYAKKIAKLLDFAVTPESTGFGIAEGLSGKALFFLYLYCTTLNMSHLNQTLNLIEPICLTFEKEPVPIREQDMSWITGTCGILSVFLRIWYVTGDERLCAIISKLTPLHSKRLSTLNKLGQVEGAAGLGEFFLDMLNFTNDQGYWLQIDEISRTLAAMFQWKGKELIIPGYPLNVRSFSWAEGTAGIGDFYLRKNDLSIDRLFYFDRILKKIKPSTRDPERHEKF